MHQLRNKLSIRDPLLIASSVGCAALWIALGVAKMLGPGPFREFIADTTGFPDSVAAVAAWLVILGEVGLGLSILLGLLQGRMAIPSTTSLIASLLVLGYLVLLADPGETCGCFGGVLEANWARRTIVAGILTLLSSWTCTRQLSTNRS